MGFRRVGKNVLESPDGYTVKPGGRDCMKYLESGREAVIQIERGLGTICVYTDYVTGWFKDGCEFPMTATDKDRVIERVSAAIRFDGSFVELSSKFRTYEVPPGEKEARLSRALGMLFKWPGEHSRRLRLFDELPPQERTRLLAFVNLEENELPVIGGFDKWGAWLLLTTRTLCWRSRAFSTVSRVALETVAPMRSDIDLKREIGKRESELTTLTFEAPAGHMHVLKIEAGGARSGLKRILMYFGAQSYLRDR